ncbi:MAG: hypothetical protein CBE33_02325 [Candidatus Pelagibacter sp. TMED273]|nr:MAG: hypothetical protein CBE33_02325 [Candidatus Pelagibacter sp. TMED273]|tara:strand:- start:23407 stop:24252 length:846 start_codon:yes stop_codon:yes gene_type:complete
MEKLKYRIKKIRFLTVISIEQIVLRIFYFFNNNDELRMIIQKNRDYLKTIDLFLPKEVYQKNDYGVQRRIYEKLENEIINIPTYSDFIVFLINKIFSDNVNYLEIGVSVLKNYLQINNGIQNSNIVAFDINEINPNFKDLKYLEKNNNNLFYFQGSVLSNEDAEGFKLFFEENYDFIFSDALHEPHAVNSEYQLIIKNNLNEKFLIYYDDLDFEGLEDELKVIKKDIEKNIDKSINFYTFSVYGWIGQNEKIHKNGILTTFNLEKIMIENKLKIYNFKKVF